MFKGISQLREGGRMSITDMLNNYYTLTKSFYALNTIEVHGYYIREISKACSFLKLANPHKLTLEHAYQINEYFKGHGKKGNDTINKMFNYFKMVLKQNHIHTTFQEFPRLKVKTNHFMRLYHDDLKSLVQYVINLNVNKNSICYKTAILLMIDSGCRLSEVINIKKRNIDFYSDPMRIYLEDTKNGKSRYVPFSDFSKPYIKELIASHDHVELFWNFKFDTSFTKYCLRSFYRYTSKKLNIERLHSHRLRKTFASLLAENGMSLYDLQLLLDHSRISTTQLYVQTKQDRGLKSYTSHNNWKLN